MDKFDKIPKEDQIIPMTEMELRAALMLAVAIGTVIIANADYIKGDAKFHRKRIEDEIEEIIKTALDRNRN